MFEWVDSNLYIISSNTVPLRHGCSFNIYECLECLDRKFCKLCNMIALIKQLGHPMDCGK